MSTDHTQPSSDEEINHAIDEVIIKKSIESLFRFSNLLIQPLMVSVLSKKHKGKKTYAKTHHSYHG